MAYQMDANIIMEAQVKAEKEIIRLRDALKEISINPSCSGRYLAEIAADVLSNETPNVPSDEVKK